MTSQLFTVIGVSNGTSTSGDMSLSSDLLYTSATYIMVPKGLKAKVWAKRISGAAATITIYFTKDITPSFTGGTVTWVALDTEYLASPGELALEKRRPIVINGLQGTEAFKVSWSQSTAGTTQVELEVELGDGE